MFGNVTEEEVSGSTEGINLSNSDGGVIPRAVKQLFNKLQSMNKVNIFCSFLQIYNEKIYDLLQVVSFLIRTSKNQNHFPFISPK